MTKFEIIAKILLTFAKIAIILKLNLRETTKNQAPVSGLLRKIILAIFILRGLRCLVK